VPDTVLEARVAAVRRFTRFYTRKAGVLEEGILKSSFSLAEARVLYELAHGDGVTATALRHGLGLDAGYLSRILAAFEQRGFLARQPSSRDRRQHLLKLTAAGRRAFAPLDRRSQADFAAMLTPLAEADQARVTAAMQTIERLLEPGDEHIKPYLLRPPRPGDMGWVVSRHGALYAQEYGWDISFEALVAGIVAEFAPRFDSKYEACWIAERDGENVGCVFVVRHSDEVAKLRLLIVEPSARGLGIGERLTEECIRFARGAGYKSLSLWTNSILIAARRIYEKLGFMKVKEEAHHSFGHDLVGETWELVL
jgi:DNA-binding MarR family transcriptional regulator/N-acetylglutamate synthase-like GNAT family acetyltransferase